MYYTNTIIQLLTNPTQDFSTIEHEVSLYLERLKNQSVVVPFTSYTNAMHRDCWPDELRAEQPNQINVAIVISD